MRYLIVLFLFSILFCGVKATSAKNEAMTATWRFPLDGWKIAYNEKDNIAVENTHYGVRNLDLFLSGPDYITCFGVAGNRALHAGVDLYPTFPQSEGGWTVRAISEGVITYIFRNDDRNGDGGIIIVQHGVGSETVYSLYRHIIEIPELLQVSSRVFAGTVLGEVNDKDHKGRFPQFHPDKKDSHLHFELRRFASAENVGLPASCLPANYLISGVGYTYPNHPDSYGYIDPVSYLESKGATPSSITVHHLSNQISPLYLPLITRASFTPTPPCSTVWNDLLPRNREFEEGKVDDPVPWITLSTFIDEFTFLPSPALISDTIYKGGHRSASMGNSLTEFDDVEQEIITAFSVPTGAKAITWSQDIEINRSLANLADDEIEFGIYEATKGTLLLHTRLRTDWDKSYGDDPEPRWARLNIRINQEATEQLYGKKLFISYLGRNHLKDGSGTTRFSVDNASLLAHCDARYNNQEPFISHEIVTIYEPNTPTSVVLTQTKSSVHGNETFLWQPVTILLGMTLLGMWWGKMKNVPHLNE